MKLTVDLSALEKAVEPLGKLITRFSIDNVLEEIAPISPEISGILNDDIPLDAIDGSLGPLTYNGHQVMLYIPDQGSFITQALAEGKQDGAKRVHIAECKTIIEMRERGRFDDRCDITNRIDGLFPVFGIDYYSKQEIKGEVDLAVCQNCLKLLNYKNFSSIPRTDKAAKYKFVHEFSYAEFFEIYSSYFKSLPKSTIGFQSSGYTSDWPSISSKLRSELNYTCEQCGLNLTDNTKLLHVHHINGNKADNSRSNLRALCVDCHKKQPHHGHLYVSHEDILKINEYRREQDKFDVFNYGKVLQYADTALEGLIMKCRTNGLPIPDLGITINDHDNMISIDLCWPRRKVAVLINMAKAQNLKNHGWNVFSAFDALNDFCQFQGRVR